MHTKRVRHMTLPIGVTIHMREIFLPQIFPTMSEHDMLKIAQWYVRERDVIQPGDQLLEIEAPVGFIDIPAPPDVTAPHRVARIAKAQGELVRLGDLMIVLEPMES